MTTYMDSRVGGNDILTGPSTALRATFVGFLDFARNDPAKTSGKIAGLNIIKPLAMLSQKGYQAIPRILRV